MNFHNIKREIKNIPYNIKNIICWIPVLWNNFDWDHDYLLDILEYKLKRIKFHFDTDSFVCEESTNQILEKVNICLEALKNVRDVSEFENKLIEKHYNKYPFRGFEECVDENGRCFHRLVEMSKDERKDFLEMTKKIDEYHDQQKHLLFDTLRDNYEFWWD